MRKFFTNSDTSNPLLMFTLLTMLLGITSITYAGIGDCDQSTIYKKDHQCANRSFCVALGANCVSCPNPINCPNGKTGSYCRWWTLTETGTCTFNSSFAQCFTCPGNLTCAEGDSYEDSSCTLSACSVIATQGGNRCAGN